MSSEYREPRMDIEANKAIVRKYLELWDTGNLTFADEVLAPGFVDHLHPELVPGLESVKKEVAAFRGAFPDAKGTIEQMIGEVDTVAFCVVLRGIDGVTFPHVRLLLIMRRCFGCSELYT